MLHPNPLRRLTIQAAMHHPYMACSADIQTFNSGFAETHAVKASASGVSMSPSSQGLSSHVTDADEHDVGKYQDAGQQCIQSAHEVGYHLAASGAAAESPDSSTGTSRSSHSSTDLSAHSCGSSSQARGFGVEHSGIPSTSNGTAEASTGLCGHPLSQVSTVSHHSRAQERPYLLQVRALSSDSAATSNDSEASTGLSSHPVEEWAFVSCSSCNTSTASTSSSNSSASGDNCDVQPAVSPACCAEPGKAVATEAGQLFQQLGKFCHGIYVGKQILLGVLGHFTAAAQSSRQQTEKQAQLAKPQAHVTHLVADCSSGSLPETSCAEGCAEDMELSTQKSHVVVEGVVADSIHRVPAEGTDEEQTESHGHYRYPDNSVLLSPVHTDLPALLLMQGHALQLAMLDVSVIV